MCIRDSIYTINTVAHAQYYNYTSDGPLFILTFNTHTKEENLNICDVILCKTAWSYDCEKNCAGVKIHHGANFSRRLLHVYLSEPICLVCIRLQITTSSCSVVSFLIRPCIFHSFVVYYEANDGCSFEFKLWLLCTLLYTKGSIAISYFTHCDTFKLIK